MPPAPQVWPVRSYLIGNGRLYLSLMADGSILEWEPLVQTGYLNQPDRELETANGGVGPDGRHPQAPETVQGTPGDGLNGITPCMQPHRSTGPLIC